VTLAVGLRVLHEVGVKVVLEVGEGLGVSVEDRLLEAVGPKKVEFMPTPVQSSPFVGLHTIIVQHGSALQGTLGRVIRSWVVSF